MSKRIILASLLALAVGSNVVLAAEESTPEQRANKETAATEPVTVLYKDNPAVTTYMRLNP